MPSGIIHQILIVGIGIRAVTTAINITTNTGKDTYRVTTIDITRNIIATIDIVDIAIQYSYTGCITTRNIIGVVSGIQLDISIRHGAIVIIIIQRTYISLTAPTINIVNLHSCALYLQEQTFRTGHTPLVTTTIQVTYFTPQQIPSGTDGHIGHVIATKQTTYLEGITLRIR